VKKKRLGLEKRKLPGRKKWRFRRAKWLYFIMNESTGYVKIGFTYDLEERLRKIRLGTPEPLTVIHKVETRFYAELEKMLHERFANKRLRGEWFALNEDDLNYVFSLRSEEVWAKLRLYYPEIRKAVADKDKKKFIQVDWEKWMDKVEIFPE
jgi:hypothetical protein